jgi:hypothetical protein
VTEPGLLIAPSVGRQAPDATFVLLNPDLEDTILSYTFGINTSDAVRSFARSFEHCYYYRGVHQVVRPANRPVEKGALIHHHGAAWVAHRLRSAAGDFEELAAFDDEPSRAQLATLQW